MGKTENGDRMPNDGASFDYVIIGGGTAGCLIAARLTEDPRNRVCLVEAGPSDRRFFLRIPAGFMKTLNDPSVTWRFATPAIPQLRDRSILIRQGRVLGGTSSINGMVYVRGQAADYDGWAAAGCTGWGFAGVEPHFRRIERFLGPDSRERYGRAGPIGISPNEWRSEMTEAFIAGAEAVNIPRNADYNGPSQEGVGYYDRSIDGRWRSTSASTALKAALRRPNLLVLTGHRALRILTEGRRATGVLCRREGRGQDLTLLARREVVLCAGTINTPKLLHLSGIGPRALLQHLGIMPVRVLPGVGQNLRDHFSVRLTARMQPSQTVNELAARRHLPAQIARWALRRPSVLGLSPALIYVFARSGPTVPRPDIQCFFSAASMAEGTEHLDPLPGITCGTYALRPESRGSVTTTSPNPRADPLVNPNYLAAEADRALMIRGVRMVRGIFAGAAMKPYLVAETNPGPQVVSDAQILDHALATGATSHHLIGTAKMGTESDPFAVVDPQLRVWGMAGLRIADASVMPSMPSGNTMAPTLMIAERAADFILSQG